MTERMMPLDDINNLDAVVHELGIEDSFETPAEAVRKLKAERDRLRAALRETTAEAVEHRKNIIECHAADPNYLTNPKYRAAYDQELARMDGVIERARAALEPPASGGQP